MMKKLPDTEFELMRVVWENEPPITTNIIMQAIGNEKGWKVPTVLTLMNRLVKKGFLKTEKNGKERTFFPLIDREDYLKFETNHFLKFYHENSFLSLVSTLYDGEKLNEDELQELMKLIEKKE
ncbi:BlaI/MecI/CopY family transcriptional regulator [Anaerosacchariphilus polymeriproducens]